MKKAEESRLSVRVRWHVWYTNIRNTNSILVLSPYEVNKQNTIKSYFSRVIAVWVNVNALWNKFEWRRSYSLEELPLGCFYEFLTSLYVLSVTNLFGQAIFPSHQRLFSKDKMKPWEFGIVSISLRVFETQFLWHMPKKLHLFMNFLRKVQT